jgi:hypothetical protein
MIRSAMTLFLFTALIILAVGCKGSGSEQRKDELVSETGTAMSGASVVRSAVLRLSGAIDKTLDAPPDEKSILIGNCSPDMWANFGIQFTPPDYVWVAVAIMTKDPIKTGQTGPIRLDWVDVTLFDNEMRSLQFKGPGSFEIKEHNADPKDRRMVGLIKAAGLEGGQDAEGQTIDAEFDFDINFSCGVNK